MSALLNETPAGATVVQIGCSSGREIAYLAERFAQHAFIGTDIDEPIIQRAQSRYQNPNLRFAVSRAHQICDVAPDHGPLIVFSSGSSQYVQPEHLEEMFAALAKRGNVVMVFSEPWSEQGIQIPHYPSRWRASFSYSHDYDIYAKNAGFAVTDKRAIQTHKDPRSPHFHTRHYFFICKMHEMHGVDGKTADHINFPTNRVNGEGPNMPA